MGLQAVAPELGGTEAIVFHPLVGTGIKFLNLLAVVGLIDLGIEGL